MPIEREISCRNKVEMDNCHYFDEGYVEIEALYKEKMFLVTLFRSLFFFFFSFFKCRSDNFCEKKTLMVCFIFLCESYATRGWILTIVCDGNNDNLRATICLED